MKFRLPDYITEGKVYVIDRVGSSDIILGEMIINLTTLLEGNRQKPINECLDVDEVLTGKINMVFIRGASS